MEGWCIIEFKKVEEGIVSIYENETKEKLINSRELFYELRGIDTKTKFTDWINDRIIKYDFFVGIDYFPFRKFTKGDENGFGNKSTKEYYLTIDTSKEICMIENNEKGRKIRRYFIEVEKRYREIINNPSNIKDISKNEYWQVYFKPKAVEEINNRFNKNKENIYYEIQYVRNTKQGKKGEIKERGYKIENICYKIIV